MAKVNTTTETITPAMAESWLEKNKDNRPVRDHHVNMLAKEMQEGRWILNGEAIVFDSNGDLVDGQHRLWASFNSRLNFDSVVVRGVSLDAFQTMDSGMKRSAGDVLAKAGLSYGTLTAGALRLIHFYETGCKDHAIVQRMSNAETMHMAEKYPRVVQAVEMTGPSQLLKRLCSLTALSACVYFALESDQSVVAEFLKALATGENLRRGDPRLTCRNFFINARARSVKIHHRVQFALLIKAWNATFEAREVTVLKFIEGEEFPQFSHRRKSKATSLKTVRA